MHANAKLTPLMRARLAREHVQLGRSLRESAAIYFVSEKTVRRWLQRARADGFPQRLQDRSSAPRQPQKISPELEATYKDAVFRILHSPPKDFGFNRTTWRLCDIQSTMTLIGLAASRSRIGRIIRRAGYRYVKAREVLTSNDPDYRRKVDNIHKILSRLKPTERFFSIDEFGPCVIKHRKGRKLVPPGCCPTVPQYHRSKGSLK